uniref:Uncharacterized protein n=1 Tax=Panagrolaimus sp. JU765 TaxID=591449 RepID=A0AC34R353_9BILA
MQCASEQKIHSFCYSWETPPVWPLNSFLSNETRICCESDVFTAPTFTSVTWRLSLQCQPLNEVWTVQLNYSKDVPFDCVISIVNKDPELNIKEQFTSDGVSTLVIPMMHVPFNELLYADHSDGFWQDGRLKISVDMSITETIRVFNHFPYMARKTLGERLEEAWQQNLMTDFIVAIKGF